MRTAAKARIPNIDIVSTALVHVFDGEAPEIVKQTRLEHKSKIIVDARDIITV